MKKDKNTQQSNRLIISDEAINSYGCWVKTEGLDISQFERNPVMLWMHYRGEIIGTIKDIRKEGDTVTGEPYFDEVTERSKTCKAQWEAGSLRMCSAGIIITEVSDEEVKPGQYRKTVVKSKLQEVSMVDIGSNDNALRLYDKSGNELNLAKGVDNDIVPLINQNNNEMKHGIFALKLGLAESATESEILARMDVLLGYQSANEQLRAERDEMTLSTINMAVDGAIAERRITAENREKFIELGTKTGLEALKLTLASINPTQKPSEILNMKSSSTGNKEYMKLSDVPENELRELRSNDKNTYMRLYKAEYGVECPKF